MIFLFFLRFVYVMIKINCEKWVEYVLHLDIFCEEDCYLFRELLSRIDQEKISAN